MFMLAREPLHRGERLLLRKQFVDERAVTHFGRTRGQNPGSTLVPSVGFGAPPKRTFSAFDSENVSAFGSVRKVREGGTPSPTLVTSVLPGTRSHAYSSFENIA